ncbi:ABC transporter permease [Polaribacter aestuariivivens]|uniref:ABC transporter permease n=1 Tax=Polaribacter aestuariivivens TaxID=2304626 RepID=A0A5S3N5E0_9FLAO|nr:ABC transporter permease [Polaribacter aestuariivivens]TMM28659.1 ABC transporter permease [Polaribacter aestuariivivens]
MNSLKNIFALKKEVPVEHIDKKEEDFKKEKFTFFESGYGSSKASSGNPVVYKACLNDVYMDYKGKCRDNINLQNELKKPYKEEKGKVEIELKKRNTVTSIIEESIHNEEKKIIEYRNDIVEVKNIPEKFGLDIDKKPKAQFYLGLIVLIPITFYLLVFYISASYSAFFKNFESDELSAAIFDGKALTKAIGDGWLEAVFVATIPFAFMGLGYLVHMFQKHKSWTSILKIGMLFLVTFVFDAILAYQIEMKIYNIEKTPDSPEFDLSIAFSSVEFWGIIFAGFVVYIIWGLVFDFIMKEYDNLDKIKSFIRTRKEDIKNSELNIDELTSKLNPIKEEISGLEGKISDLQRTIDGFIFSDKQYLTYHAEYVKGWYSSITDHLPLKRADDVLAKCVEVEKQHLADHSIDDNNSEGILYKLIN